MLPSNLVSLFYLTLYLVNLDMVNCATSGLGNYRCHQSNYYVGVTDKDLESDSVHRRVLESNSGNIIDYQMTTGTLPRTEVVNAVLAAKRGKQNFELLSTTGAALFFQDLTLQSQFLNMFGHVLKVDSNCRAFQVVNFLRSNHCELRLKLLSPLV